MNNLRVDLLRSRDSLCDDGDAKRVGHDAHILWTTNTVANC